MTGEQAADAFARNIRALEHPDLSEAARKSAQAMLEQTVHEFVRSVDPDGNPWPPVKRKTPPVALVETGAMLAQTLDLIYHAQIYDDGFELFDADASLPPYWKVHDAGAGRVPRREFLGIGRELLDKAAEFGYEELERKLFEAWD